MSDGKAKPKEINIKVPSKATDDEILELLRPHLKEIRTAAKMVNGKVVVRPEDKMP